MTIRGTKRAGGESLLRAPVAVTAFGEEQLNALQFRDIEDLTFSVPNVSLDSVGTVKGVANFSIRGLGVNSSIPSIDPAVGLFFNGVYLGTNVGAVLDSFDLEAVEVLRGPQGILFGRNVTGGAVLVQTKRPGDFYSSSARVNVETGLEYRVNGAVDAPILPDLLKIRVAGQYRNDDGWFENLAPVDDPTNPLAPETELQDFGEEETWLIRPTVTLTPTQNLTFHVTYEHGETEGQGPPAQSTAGAPSSGPPRPPNFEFNDFDFSIDEPGFISYNWDAVYVEAVWDLGRYGVITDIFGFRDVETLGLSDIDSSPLLQFHAGVLSESTQISNELRYSGTFFDDVLDLTAGFYVFDQDIIYREQRILVFGAINSTLGGDQDQLSLGVFTALEVHLTDSLSILGGLRYTYERKEAQIATFNPAAEPCSEPLGRDCDFDFVSDVDFNNVSPKLGLQWEFMDDNQLYGHWTQGFRSGGYNLRNTSPDPSITPGPFDEEQANVFEVGLKSSLWNRRLRFGVAGFVTLMDDLQREVNIPAAGAAVVQIIDNTADATIAGFEFETTIQPVSGLVFTGSFGFTEDSYRDVRFDLNGDGQVDEADEDLSIPRVENLSASVVGLYDLRLGGAGVVTLRAAYAYRDDSFFTDNNLGVLPSGHVVDASVAYALPDIDLGRSFLAPRFTFYAQNLANEAFLGGQTVLPPALSPEAPPLGGNFSPLKEGRVFGGEFRIDWY